MLLTNTVKYPFNCVLEVVVVVVVIILINFNDVVLEVSKTGSWARTSENSLPRSIILNFVVGLPIFSCQSGKSRNDSD